MNCCMPYLMFYAALFFTADKYNVIDAMILHQRGFNCVIRLFSSNVHLVHHQQMRSDQVKCFLKFRVSARYGYVKGLLRKHKINSVDNSHHMHRNL